MLPESTFIPLEFIRPYWLLGILAVLLFSLSAYRKNKKTNVQHLIAQHLTEQLVTSSTQEKTVRFAFPLLAVICSIALSGPSYRQVELPVHELEKAQVLLLDLSYSMYATDISPNRLSRAKYKAIDLIQKWSEGEKALIAYAGDAFTISPLTKDGKTIINQIPHLSPDIMPVTGERADLALEKAIMLLENAGYNEGHIVFISDDISTENSKKMIKRLAGTNWVVSILAVATKQGAPIKLPDGSLLKDSSGKIVVPILNEQNLYDISSTSNGLYLTFSNNNKDIEQLAPFFEAWKTADGFSAKNSARNNFLIDDGYWLSFLLLPLFLLLFRKGLFYTLLFSLLLPLSSPKVEASLWKNSQQNGYQAYLDKEYQQASELYNTPLEKGSALYKNKQYQQSLEQFTQATEEDPNNADAFYNQGNSYAQLEKFEEAIDAYQQALTLRTGFKQASENKELIEQIKKQQEQQENQQQENQQQENQQQENQQQENQQQENQQQENQQQENQQQENQQQENQQQESQQQENQQQENQQQENQQQENQQQENQQQENQQQENQQQENQQQENQQQEAQEQKAQQQQEEEEEQAEKNPQQEAALQQAENEESNQELEDLPNWLKNMPDDPSLLLRNKMGLEYRKRALSRSVKQQNNGDAW